MLLGKGWTETELCRVKPYSCRVHNIHSQRWELDLPDGAELAGFTCLRLKRRLEDLHGLAVEDQVLRFRGRALEDDEPLVSCGVGSGASILLGLLRREGAKQTAAEGEVKPGSTQAREKHQGSLTETVAEAGAEP